MRPYYVVNSKDIMLEFNNLQETLLSLIGYDQNPFDNIIEKNGDLLDLQNQVDNFTEDILNNRLFTDKSYNPHYRNKLITKYVRRYNG